MSKLIIKVAEGEKAKKRREKVSTRKEGKAAVDALKALPAGANTKQQLDAITAMLLSLDKRITALEKAMPDEKTPSAATPNMAHLANVLAMVQAQLDAVK